MIGIGTTIALAFVIYFVVYCYKNAFKTLPNFPPGPPRLPIYGSYWIVLACAINNLSLAFKRLGKWYDTKLIGLFLGPIPAVIVNDSALIKEMLNREEFDGRMDIILARLRAYWKRLGIFFTDGYLWHVQRRFSLRYMRDYGFGRRDGTLESILESEIKEMLDMTIHGPTNNAEMELVKGDLIYLPHYFAAPFMNGLLHIISRMTIPRSNYKVLWELAEGALIFQRNSNDLGAALSLTPWLKDVLPNYSGYNALKKGNQCLLDFFTDLVNNVVATHDPSHDRHFLDMYIKKMKSEIDEKGKSTFSVDQLVLTCIDYMFPAATAVEAVLTMLVEHLLLRPDIQDRVHEEIDRVVGSGRLPNLDDRKNMPYTEACLREAMRFDTLVPLGVPHRAITDTTFHGYKIPEGTMVSTNYYILHMDKTIWGDPENFRPERFIVNGRLDVSLDKSLPFGAGRRLCAGETYARQSMFQVFAAFMQAFRVSPADGHRLRAPSRRLQGIITTIPEYWVRVTPRQPSV
ncbi:probable cytochrome P450 304a1 [Galleria mellonella]|uniref:Probable cytochrome P450 304a1 n=1 Tax=Galleria mellonella TaxID=7137 RepID=A0A6J1WT13_GALME|nr:probable cytochrome P450 304a1 [Galleria mellonella]